MKSFIENLCSDEKLKKRYFLQWLQLELNKLSDQIMPKVLQDYNKAKKLLGTIIECKYEYYAQNLNYFFV